MKWGLGNFSVNAETWYPTFLELSEMKLRGDIKLKLRIIPPNESEIMWTHYYHLKHYDRLDLLIENYHVRLLSLLVQYQVMGMYLVVT